MDAKSARELSLKVISERKKEYEKIQLNAIYALIDKAVNNGELYVNYNSPITENNKKILIDDGYLVVDDNHIRWDSDKE